MIRDKYLAEGTASEGPEETENQAADDYLSKLAQSILSKDKKGPKVPAHGETASSRMRTPRPAPASPASTPPPVMARMPKTPVPTPGLNQSSSVATATAPARGGEWVREVSFRDAEGNLIPGTILLFEDGTVGVFKEMNPVKEYDIVYVLQESGRVSPQGMALHTYEVEPIGRLGQAVFEQLVRSGRWERDMMVFHLVKYKDRVHIPAISGSEPSPATPDERVTNMPVQQVGEDESVSSQPTQPKEKPAFIRGRRLTIEFGPQKWDAIYWGKDELGHVVAHNTHDKWALMHLDLGRFKDSIIVGEFVEDEALKKMERDFNAA